MESHFFVRAAVIFCSNLPPTSVPIGRISESLGVALYFFHFSDGERHFSDDVGHECRGLAAARKHAVGQVRELKAAMCDPHIQDLSGWSMTVVDVNGQRVFEIGFDLKPPR
jgi:hypothetical protein